MKNEKYRFNESSFTTKQIYNHPVVCREIKLKINKYTSTSQVPEGIADYRGKNVITISLILEACHKIIHLPSVWNIFLSAQERMVFHYCGMIICIRLI